ncbi:MAG TPA: response regulator, partial [Cyclobacteriaceae bacterium]|nr:response regulator [Cyclobacteriaceae bacterium]
MVEARLTGKAYPDFIMLDLNMPMMGGFAFLEACHKLPERLPQQVKIIIISSSLDKRDRDRALHLGASHYLIKPVTETDLEAILRSSESK